MSIVLILIGYLYLVSLVILSYPKREGQVIAVLYEQLCSVPVTYR